MGLLLVRVSFDNLENHSPISEKNKELLAKTYVEITDD
jgi:hypothetical protein